MKLIWSPETASKVYIDTVKSCKLLIKHPGEPEFIAAMAGGWNAKLIVEAWSHGSPVSISLGLAQAARHTCGRHVCIVQDERSRLEYCRAMREVGVSSSPEVVVVVGGEAAEGVVGVDFLVVDCRRKDYAKVLRFAKLSHKGAVIVCNNSALRSSSSEFKWNGTLDHRTRVVKSMFLPIGKGLNVAHVANNGGSACYRKGPPTPPSRWIKHVDQESGEEHVFRR